MTSSAVDRRISHAGLARSLQSLTDLQQVGLAAAERLARHQYALAGQSLEWTLAQLRLVAACAPWSAITACDHPARAPGGGVARRMQPRGGTEIRAPQPRTARAPTAVTVKRRRSRH